MSKDIAEEAAICYIPQSYIKNWYTMYHKLNLIDLALKLNESKNTYAHIYFIF